MHSLGKEINFAEFVPKFDAILSRGLSSGLGQRDGQMCIEAAVCAALDLPHGDDPTCVASAVRRFKIILNDASWSSPQARAKALRNLGISQVGSRGVVNDYLFASRLAELTIRRLIPKLFRQYFSHVPSMLATALHCEQEGSADAAAHAAGAAYAAADRAAARAAYAAARAAAGAAAAARADAADAADRAADADAADAAARAAADAADAAAYAAARAAARAAAAAAYAADRAAARAADAYLILSADLALEVLRELNSPGCKYI